MNSSRMPVYDRYDDLISMYDDMNYMDWHVGKDPYIIA